MKKIKLFSYISFALLNVYAILLISVIVLACIGVETNEEFTVPIQSQLLACLCIIVVLLILGFINLLLCIKNRSLMQEKPPLKMTLIIKLGLIPFFIVNFIFWAIMWIGTFNIFLIAFAPTVWAISLISTYLFLLVEGGPNIVYLIDSFFKKKKIIYLICVIAHFIYLADIVGALVIYQYEKNNKLEQVLE